MKYLIILTFTTVLAIGCAPYPRYGKHTPSTPQEKVSEKGTLTTNEAIEFGMILREYLGRPYKGTSSYDEGLDCSMFTQQVYREFNGTALPRTSADQFKTGKEVHYRMLEYGDLVFFRTVRGRVSHVGIYIGNGEFMHTSSSNGVIVSHLTEDYWADRWAGARRVLK